MVMETFQTFCIIKLSNKKIDSTLSTSYSDLHSPNPCTACQHCTWQFTGQQTSYSFRALAWCAMCSPMNVLMK